MKTITLHIPDEIYAKLRNAVGIRIMSGASYGITDDFNRLLVSLIDKGATEHTFAVPPKKG